MHIDSFWQHLWAWPALLTAGWFGHSGGLQPGAAAPAPTPTPAAIHRTVPTTTPKASPKPTAAPKPTSSPAATPAPTKTPVAAAAAEIASEQTCPGQGDVSKTAAALTCLTANARVYHGLAAVSANSKLMAAAGAKAQDMKTCGYGHTACGRAFDYWTTAKGYTGRCDAENIAMGQKTPREVFVAWMNSPGHRENILNPNYKDIGVAELAGTTGPLWAMELGGC